MEVLNSVLEHIIDLYSRIENRETDIITKIQEYYLKAQYRKEGYHPYCDAKGEFTAKLIRVEPDGHLILKDKNGSLRKYAFKEVNLICEMTNMQLNFLLSHISDMSLKRALLLNVKHQRHFSFRIRISSFL